MAVSFRVSDLPEYAVMGVVNVTPDSFSDGGRFFDTEDAIAHAGALVEAGAVIVDIGGESTRPGAEPVDALEEMARVIPVIEAVASRGDVLISVDTTKASVADRALQAGASVVNDVSGGVDDPEILAVVASRDAGLVAMHRRGTPRTMQTDTHYDDVVNEVAESLEERFDVATSAGVRSDAVLLDPGIGFAKDVDGNLRLLGALDSIVERLPAPVLIGASRKSFLGAILGESDASARDDGTLATTAWAFVLGVRAVRVHDVASSVRAGRFIEVLDRATAQGVAA